MDRAVPGGQADPATTAMRQDAEVVVLDLVNPTGSRRAAAWLSLQARHKTVLGAGGAGERRSERREDPTFLAAR